MLVKGASGVKIDFWKKCVYYVIGKTRLLNYECANEKLIQRHPDMIKTNPNTHTYIYNICDS